MDEENLKETNNDAENDVEIINKTIPVVVVAETSFHDSKNESGDRANAHEESFVTETAPAEIAHATHSSTDATFDEEQLIDMVVVDDDDDFSPAVDVKCVKREPKCSTDAHPNNEILDTKPNLSLPQKFETDVKDAKDVKDVKDVKAQNTIETSPNSSKSPLSSKPPKDDIFLVHCAIRQSLSNETFVLQLDNSDALDSYLDKTANESADQKSMKNLGSTEKEDGEASDMKENDSNQLNIAQTKATESEKVCDALILTADDELETELSLEEKHTKALGKGLGPDKSAVSGQCPAAPRLQPDTNIDGKLVMPKTEPSESAMEVAGKGDGPHLTQKETNKNPAFQDKPDNKSGSKKTDALATNIKPRNALSATSRVLWVSNVTQSVRASDLKQYITRIGKVVTAKIVTDGKKCYGYVVMDTSEDAGKCLKTLNNAYFEGRKISLSFARPPRTDKKEDPSKFADGDKFKSTKIESSFGGRTSGNETDDIKVRKSKERNTKVSKGDTRKRHRSHSRSLSSRISKRQSPNDPLTTKFDGRKRVRSGSRRKSRSRDRKYLREKEERERLQRNLLEEQRRNRDEMLKQIQREEKHREVEFKLEQERRKLQLERELFEKERRELTRLDVERRKIERERLEVLKQRSKLQEELQKTRMKRKPDKFTMSSVIGKPQESNELYEKRNEALKRDDDYNRKPSGPKHPFQKTVKNYRDERKMSNESKSAATSSSHRTMPKPDRMDFKSIKDASKVVKTYEKSAPPPPKLTNDFDRKPKHSERKHEYPDGKPAYGDRKTERGARKIEVIERKYYQERSSEVPERKHERIYRKPEFEGRKPHMFAERKYDYGRDAKRYPDENYPERDTTQRIQWPAASVNYNDPWKAAPPGPVSGSSTARYQEPNFPASSYGGPSRIAPFYYHPTPAPQEYPRYDHCSQANGRKY